MTEEKKKLNRKQQILVDKIIDGEHPTTAYQETYNCTSYNSAGANASRLLKNDKFKRAYEAELRRINEISILNAEQRQKILSEIAINSKSNTEKIKSVDVLNKMTGQYIEQIKQDVDIELKLDDNIKEWAEYK